VLLDRRALVIEHRQVKKAKVSAKSGRPDYRADADRSELDR
jgi:hypothetical protein